MNKTLLLSKDIINIIGKYNLPIKKNDKIYSLELKQVIKIKQLGDNRWTNKIQFKYMLYSCNACGYEFKNSTFDNTNSIVREMMLKLIESKKKTHNIECRTGRYSWG
jgi:hypothetical protein